MRHVCVEFRAAMPQWNNPSAGWDCVTLLDANQAVVRTASPAQRIEACLRRNFTNTG